MSYAVEELVKHQREEERLFANIDTAAGMLADGLITEDYIESFFRFTPEQMTEVRSLASEQKSPVLA